MIAWHKDPTYMERVIARFYERANISPEDECWIWEGGTNGSEYGQMAFRGSTWTAHRISYVIFKSEIPDGLHIDHLCSNTLCVNPGHLEAVTHTENVRRGVRGKRKPTEAEIALIQTELSSRIEHCAQRTGLACRDIVFVAIRGIREGVTA